MFIAITKELKYNQFAVSKNEMEAEELLANTVQSWFEHDHGDHVNRMPCHVDVDIDHDNWEMEITTPMGRFHTAYAVIEVNERGLSQFGNHDGEPGDRGCEQTCGEWHH